MNLSISGGVSSFLSEINPAVKLIVFLAVIHSAASSASLPSYIFFTLLFMAYTYLSETDIFVLAGRLKPFLVILLTTFLINIFFGSGLMLSAELTYRFLLIILFSILLTMSMEPGVMATLLLSPFRGKHAENLRTVFMVALEFIPVFIQEVKAIAADIKQMPEYSRKAYRAFFKPALYLKPLMDGLAEKSALVAADVESGRYAPTPLTKPSRREYIYALSALSAAVVYALV